MKREHVVPSTPRPWIAGHKTLMSSIFALVGLAVLPTQANAWVQWIRYPYPAIDNPGMTPTKNCREVYEWGRSRGSERMAPHAPAFRVHFQLHEPYATQAWLAGDGEEIDGVWTGNPPAGISRRKAGSCWALVPADRTPLQADQDFSGEVVDHEWFPEFVFPRPPSQPIAFPPPPPPPPQFTKEELDSFTYTFTGPDGTKRHWVRGFRNVDQINGNDLIETLQTGWILYQDKNIR
ncbi:MAG: hypothetical protein IPK97_00500 [Ahniella sp.]|nr:hypothetical protein [Ahniella sp.]